MIFGSIDCVLVGNIEVRLGSLTHLAVDAGRARGADAVVMSAWCAILVLVKGGRGSARVRGVEVLVVLGRTVIDCAKNYAGLMGGLFFLLYLRNLFRSTRSN